VNRSAGTGPGPEAGALRRAARCRPAATLHRGELDPIHRFACPKPPGSPRQPAPPRTWRAPSTGPTRTAPQSPHPGARHTCSRCRRSTYPTRAQTRRLVRF
jgi:hypothetical protein